MQSDGILYIRPGVHNLPLENPPAHPNLFSVSKPKAKLRRYLFVTVCA